MIKFFKQKNKNSKEKGFTLIETLVALAIFSIAIIGMMTVLSSGLSDTIAAKKKMAAAFLAQEGIEYVRNIRDTYVLYWGTYTDGWNEFNTRLYSVCGAGKECFFNDENLNFSNPAMPITSIDIFECDGVGACPFITYDESSGKYVSGGSIGENTSFVRAIKTEKITSDETKITSTVLWDNGSKSVSLSESLFNWVE